LKSDIRRRLISSYKLGEIRVQTLHKIVLFMLQFKFRATASLRKGKSAPIARL
jgi:hypothetical protein